LKILFVHEVDYRNKVIFEIHEFPELMAMRGHEISFFQFPEKDGNGSVCSQSGSLLIPGRAHSQVSIKLITPWHTGNGQLDRFICFVSSYFSLKKDLAKNHYDAIVLYAVPTYGLQVINVARKHGIPVMFRALDVSHKIRKSIFSKLIYRIETYLYRTSDLLSANNPAMLEYCEAISNRTRQSIVNYPPLDLKHFEPQPRDNHLLTDLGLSEKDQVITYMGSFFYFSGLAEVIFEFAKHRKDHENLKLLLIGGGEQDVELRKIVKELELDSCVIFTSFVAYQELPKYLALGDIAINPLQKSLVTDVAFPHKVLQYLAAGLPVVSTQLDGLYKTFGDKSGIHWENGAANIVESCINLLSMKSELELSAKIGLKSVNELFGVDKAVDSFERAVQGMVSKN
jgi:glycosyltransferase involved in cell wall biosynthesis